MDSKKGLIAGGAVLIIGGLLAVLIAVPLLFTTLIGGSMMNILGTGAGALGHEENEQQQESQCMAPGGTYGAMTASQQQYVRTIVGVAKDLDVPERGQIIAVMVALQESGIQNYANNGENRLNYNIGTPQGTQYWLDVAKLSLNNPYDAVGNDADSVGLFQQRASAGWADTAEDGFKAVNDNQGAINRLMNPEFSTRAFFGGPGGVSNRGLLDIDGWESMGLSQAAQAVQGSAFPSAYAKWESQARSLVQANSDAPAIGSDGTDNDSDDSDDNDSSSSGNFAMPMEEGTYTVTSPFGWRNDPVNGARAHHNGQDLRASMETPIYAMADGEVVAAGPSNGFGNWIVIDHSIGGTKYSTVYGHMQSHTLRVSTGDTVTQGQHIAGVGNEGHSAGPHLHFEVWDGGRLSNGTPIDPMQAVDSNFTGGGGGGSCSSGDAITVSASGDVQAIIEAGKSQLGVDYSWGGGSLNGPSEGFGAGAGISGYDCSSLVRYMVYNGTGRGYELPRTSREQYQATKGNIVANPGDGADKLQPGDILFYSRGGDSGIYHVAMYIGNGEMIEAPQTGDVVKITEVRLGGNFYGATRIDFKETSA